MRYATVCSGIEACSVAWEPLGWQPVFFSEIEKFPCQTLTHHYPNTPNLGDMTKINGNEYRNTIDVFCGGTPCQSFSIAGLRGGLSDNRGNLALTFCRLVDQIRPKWVIWENVSGVLSSHKGRDFGSIIGALVELGYGFAYRVLDAQHFGVPQRRRRVFVVAHIGGNWAAPAAVLFEPESVCGDSTPGGGSREKVTGFTTDYARNGSEWPAKVAPTLDRSFARLQGQDNQHIDGGGGLYVGGIDASLNYFRDTAGALTRPSNYGLPGVYCTVANSWYIRRITPIEAERLQGFPDGYTKISSKSNDTPRYAALGNSMAVPVMQWIGKRIELVEKLLC